MTPAAVEAASVDAVAFRAGAACAAWAMPMSEECVPQTRRLLRQVAADLGLVGNPDLVDAIRLVATEMTTNALLHGGKRVVMREGRPVAGLPELWVYLRGSAYREMVLTVYDTGSGWRNNVEDAGAADELREDGRGLKILTELAGDLNWLTVGQF